MVLVSAMAVVVVVVVIVEAPGNANQVFLTLPAVATGELSAGKVSGGMGLCRRRCPFFRNVAISDGLKHNNQPAGETKIPIHQSINELVFLYNNQYAMHQNGPCRSESAGKQNNLLVKLVFLQSNNKFQPHQ